MPENTPPRTFGELAPSEWPGERLGLPDKGSGSVGRVGRRLVALLLDWAIAVVAVFILFPSLGVQQRSLLNLAFFVVLQILFIPTIGGSIGHRLLGLRLVAIDGRWVGPWRPITRTVLLVLIIPALVWDSDQRGFHDKIAGTVLIRA